MFLTVLALGFAASPELDAVLDHPDLAGALVGAYVGRLDGTAVYARNSDMRVVPASNQKLLATAFALDQFGPDWKPRTEFWKEPDAIVVRTTGDPMTTHAELREIGTRLGVRPGVPVRVQQPFEPAIPPSWEWDDLPNKYAAQVASLTVDRGSFELWGGPGGLRFKPDSYGVRVVHFDSDSPVSVDYRPNPGISFVNGKLPDKEARLDTLALPNPTLAAAMALGGGSVRSAFTVPDRAPDVVHEGQSVAAMVDACLVPSDNNLAEGLLLLATAKASGKARVTYADAARELRAFLRRVLGAAGQDFRPDDGSGMSRHKIVSARGLGALLAWASRQTWASVFRSSLASPGKGTLSSRLAQSSFRGKTGTLDMVSALSGYVRVRGETLVVSLVMNHYGCTAARARALQDDFVRTLERGTLPGNATGIPWNRAYSLAQQFHRAPVRWGGGLDSDVVVPRPGHDRRGQPRDAGAAVAR